MRHNPSSRRSWLPPRSANRGGPWIQHFTELSPIPSPDCPAKLPFPLPSDIHALLVVCTNRACRPELPPCKAAPQVCIKASGFRIESERVFVTGACSVHESHSELMMIRQF